jgi:chorismate-pyruvate lyase
MAEALDPEGMLRTIARFPPLARVLIATVGTLQGTLSAYFATPVLVRVVGQHRGEDGHYERHTNLCRKDTGQVVCRASATLEVNRDDIRELIDARIHGLGQILALLDIATTFELEEVGNDRILWRRYRLWGEGFLFLITEHFAPAAFSVLSP